MRFGCHPPPSLCYLPGPVNGVADGTCVGTGTRQGTVGDAACHTCDPSRNEFGYSNLPAGTACSVCTGSGCSCYTGACSADGRCLATCHADWPNCYDVCTPF